MRLSVKVYVRSYHLACDPCTALTGAVDLGAGFYNLVERGIQSDPVGRPTNGLPETAP